MKKITVFGILNINNGGDEILKDTTIHILNQISDFEIKSRQMIPLYRELGISYLFEWCIGSGLIRLSYRLRGNISYRLFNIGYMISNFRYLWKSTNNTDGIVYAIGMLKYSTQDLSYAFDLINRIASFRKIPVMISAASVEKPDDNDWRYHQLIRAVNRSAVKFITTRDGKWGLERLQKYYVKRNNIVTDFVGDPALWIPECYKTKREYVTSASVSNKIRLGINLIRKDIYDDYDGGLESAELKDFYLSLIRHFQQRDDVEFSLFCNGTDSDFSFGLELISILRLDKKKLLPKPQSAIELVEIISGFDAVFGARLHSCIIPTSLRIPISGIIWDDKLKFFSMSVGINDYFSGVDEVKSLAAIQKVEKSFTHNYNEDLIDGLKNKTARYIADFVHDWL